VLLADAFRTIIGMLGTPNVQTVVAPVALIWATGSGLAVTDITLVESEQLFELVTTSRYEPELDAT